MTRGRSLEGRTVMVTRPAAESRELVDRLEERGATCLLAPAIRLVRAPRGALEDAVDDLLAGGFDWVLFTSRAGVKAIADAMAERRAPPVSIPARVAAVGEGTAAALRGSGIEPALVPATFTTHALSRAMPRGSGRVLLPRADIATGELEAALSSKGWVPVRVDAYRTRLSRRLPAAAAHALRAGRVDAVTFTSASTVDGFVGMLASEALLPDPRPLVVCIGPVTARTATDHGLAVAAVARPHTIGGLVAALERLLVALGGRTKEVR